MLPLLVFGQFSPQDDVEAVWVRLIDSATNRVYVSCFGLSNEGIAEALVRKAAQGVRVVVCVDRRQSKLFSDRTSSLAKQGVEVVRKRSTALEHNKLAVVDGQSAIVGSWNLSKSAQKQDNSVVVFWSLPVYAKPVEDAWQTIYERDRQ